MDSSSVHKEAKDSYDKISQIDENERLELPFRKFNNFVKVKLIQYTTYCLQNRPLRVLDLACGRGGDLFKWLYNTNIFKYDGYDISDSSIEEARKRVANSELCAKRSLITLETQNCFTKQFLSSLESESFEIISCQFAIHYGLSTFEFTKYFFEQLTRILTPNGYFIGTMVDHTKLSINGNDLFSIQFSSQQHREDAVKGERFGISYSFTMDGHVEGHEYAIPWNQFVQCANDAGLTIVPDGTSKFEKIRSIWKPKRNQPNMSKAEKELVDIYKAFAFMKM
jgi:mRNA (guanine-N7-)-methyltransferase